MPASGKQRIGLFWAQLRKWQHRDVWSFSASPAEAVAEGAGNSTFGRTFFAHEGRDVVKWSHYLDAYDEQFDRYRAGFRVADGTLRPLRFLELGVQHGGSLQVWRSYFGGNAAIWGVDIDPRCAAAGDADLHVRIGSQADPEFLRGVVAEMGGVDVVLDDASHIADHQRTSFETLFPLLSDGGTYAVEDLHTSYWRDFGGRYGRGRSFVEMTKQMIDDMHAPYHRKGAKLPVDASANIPSVTYYDSMVFIRKAKRRRPMVIRHGTKLY